MGPGGGRAFRGAGKPWAPGAVWLSLTPLPSADEHDAHTPSWTNRPLTVGSVSLTLYPLFSLGEMMLHIQFHILLLSVNRNHTGQTLYSLCLGFLINNRGHHLPR